MDMDHMYHSTPLDTGNPGRGRNKERTKEGKAKKVQRARAFPTMQVLSAELRLT